MGTSRAQSKRASAALDAAAAKAPRKSQGEPGSPWPILLSRVAFVFTLALVIARALMSEVVRGAMDVTFGLDEARPEYVAAGLRALRFCAGP